jgi:hypothetical protein
MAAVHKFSERVIDYAERLSYIADAAQGKHHRRVRTPRWLLLPATGAALYAVLRSDMFSRQAKEVVEEAKSRASDLPDDLVMRVRQASGQKARQRGSQSRRSGPTTRRTSSPRGSTSSRRTKAASG